MNTDGENPIPWNNEQLKVLEEYKEKQFALKKDIHQDLFPIMIGNFRQIRELTQNIAIISGAIAAFTIPVLSTELIQTTFLAYTSVALLFTAIGYSIYHLTEVLPKETNDLAKQHSILNSILDKAIDEINKTILTGNMDNLKKTNEEDVNQRLSELKVISVPDNSLDILRTILIAALVYLFLSFIPLIEINFDFSPLSSIPSIPALFDNDTFKIILSAFFGGLFAGIFASHYEDKRKRREKGREKYFDHRNTIVQIEHELVPLRLNTARNLYSIQDALDYANSSNNIRVILRFYKLSLSTGLSLKLLDIDIINEYANLYIQVESLNSDIEYATGMAEKIGSDLEKGTHKPGMLGSYIKMLNHMKTSVEKLDQMSLKLLARCEAVIEVDDEIILKEYIKNGIFPKYNFTNEDIDKEIKDIKAQEKGETKPDTDPGNFFAPYIDVSPP